MSRGGIVSDITTAVRTRLLALTDLTAVVGTKIYFDNLPEGIALPAIVIYLAADTLIRDLANPNDLRRAVLSIEVYATSHTDVETAGAAIVAGLEKQSGTWGSVTVRESLVDGVTDTTESPNDGSETFRRVRIISVIVWHT